MEARLGGIVGHHNPLGRDLFILGRAYRIIGVMESKGQILGEDLDKFVMVPYGTLVSLQVFDGTLDYLADLVPTGEEVVAEND